MSGSETIGDYLILGRLALGGMAEILLAKRVGPMGFSKPVVLKRLLPQLATDTMFTTMFLNEAKLAARLTHPNIVQINDLGQSGASFYIAMEYLPGEDLATVVRVLGARKTTVPVPLAVRIVADAAAALHYAHEATGDEGGPLHIVHRDVSPQNIVLTTAGVVKLVDFGIAKAEDRAVKTQTGIVKGKVEYMPPEQLAGQRVDRRADIFALGVVLYEALCGRRPVDASVSVGDRLAGAAVDVPLSERMPSVHPELARIVTKAIAADPKNRHQTADELRVELEAFLEANGTGVGLAELAQLLVTTFGARHVAALDRRSHSFQGAAPGPVAIQGAAPNAALPGGAPVRDGGTQLRPRAEVPREPVALDVRPPAPSVGAVPRWPRRVGNVATAVAVLVSVLGCAVVFATHRDRERVSLHVTSTPVGAAVLVDDVPAGNTPVDVEDLIVGRAVDVRIVAAGHQPYREIVTPLSGVVARALHATLSADAPAPVAVHASAPPSMPSAPVNAPVAVAQAEPMEKATASDAQRIVEPRRTGPRKVEPRQTEERHAPVPTTGSLTVTSGVPMRIFADGVDLGMTPVTRALVRAGSVALKIVSPGDAMSRTTTVEVAPDATVVHRVGLERGSLSVEGAAGARVFVGSRELGVTPLASVPLLAGDYVVTVERAGSGERTRHPVSVQAKGSHLVRAD